MLSLSSSAAIRRTSIFLLPEYLNAIQAPRVAPMRTHLDIRKKCLSGYIQFPNSTNTTHFLSMIIQLDKSSRRPFSSASASFFNHDGKMIRKAVAAKNPEQAELLLLSVHQEWRKGHINQPPSIEQLHSVLQAWCHSSNPERAKDLLTKWNELSDYTVGPLDFHFPNSVSYNLVIASICKTSQCEIAAKEAHALLDEMREKYASGIDEMQPNTLTFNSVMSTWVRLGKTDKVQVVWNDLYSDYLKDNTKDGKDYSTANKPDSRSFQFILDSLAESRSNPERAEELLGTMWELNVAPTTKHYNSVLHGWVRFEGYHSGVRAEALLAEMRDKGQAGDYRVPPDLNSFSTTIAAWSKSGHQDAVNKVESILEEMLDCCYYDRDLWPDTWSYNTVLRTIAQAQVSDKAERASRIIRRMRANTVPSDSYTRELVRKCGSNWL